MEKETDIAQIDLGSHQRCHIIVALLTLGMVPIEWVISYGRLQTPINGQIFQHGFKGGSEEVDDTETPRAPGLPHIFKKRKEVGKARNEAAQFVMSMPKDHRPKYLFFFGDDMIAPWDGLVRLYEEAEANHWDVLTGLYYWKGEPPTPLTWRNDKIGRLIPGRDFKVGDVISVDMTGLDFTLIRVSLLEAMDDGNDFFRTGPSIRKNIPKEVDEYTSTEAVICHTEDVWFYGKARKLGAKIGVHSGIRIPHLDVRTGMVY